MRRRMLFDYSLQHVALTILNGVDTRPLRDASQPWGLGKARSQTHASPRAWQATTDYR